MLEGKKQPGRLKEGLLKFEEEIVRLYGMALLTCLSKD